MRPWTKFYVNLEAQYPSKEGYAMEPEESDQTSDGKIRSTCHDDLYCEQMNPLRQAFYVKMVQLRDKIA